MKKITIALVSVLFIACSAPKYTYYFDHYPSKKTTSLNSVTAEKKEEIVQNAESSFEPIRGDQSTLIAPPELTASASDEPIIQTNTQVVTTNVHDVALKRTNAEKRGFLKNLKNFIKSPDGIQEGGSKNGFAIAGFVCALVGLFILWPLCILGLIFSAIGLKSKLKGLAIAGLVLGIVGVVLVLVVAANGDK